MAKTDVKKIEKDTLVVDLCDLEIKLERDEHEVEERYIQPTMQFDNDSLACEVKVKGFNPKSQLEVHFTVSAASYEYCPSAWHIEKSGKWSVRGAKLIKKGMEIDMANGDVYKPEKDEIWGGYGRLEKAFDVKKPS